MQFQFLKHWLQRLHEVLKDKFPGCIHSIPSPDQIDIQKLGNGGCITTDTCNAARKVQSLFRELVPGSTTYDCMNHLRNVWFGAMEKEISKVLNVHLRACLEDIDPMLRVTASMSAIIRAVDKEFSLSANYPKGHGNLFLEWIREYHPGVLLLHVERAGGSRQDLCTEGSMAIYMNHPYYVQFLDNQLRKYRKDKPSLLQQNLFIALTSQEMIALSRLLSIFHIAVCIPFRWLAGKTHELKDHGWGPLSMSRVIDTLFTKMSDLSNSPSLIENDEFMMNIFREYLDELPPFKKYWGIMFEKKMMSVVARSSKDGSKVVHMARLRKELFSTSSRTNAKTKDLFHGLAKTAAGTICMELLDESKATYKYTSQSNSEFSYKNCTLEMRTLQLGKRATNDEAESALGGTTAVVQRYGRIDLSSAAAMSDTHRNKFLQRDYQPARKKSAAIPQGMLFGLSDEVREAIVLVAIQDAPSTRKANNADILAQETARRKKEELAKEKSMANASEQFIDGMYYWRMYFSKACWKDNSNVVATNLNRLKSDTARYNALKENILIRVNGFGWDWCKHAWSKNGTKYTIAELSAHLQYIIKEEKVNDIPSEPPLKVPTRANLPILGTQTHQVQKLDGQYLVNENSYKLTARTILHERELRGEGSIHESMQSWFPPALCDLVDERIDVLAGFVMPDTIERDMRWCQGKVIEVHDKKKNTVKVCWDPIPDCAGWETSQETLQKLPPAKWNKNVDGAWRMDLPIEFNDTSDEKEEEEEDEDEGCEVEDETEMSDSDSES